MTSGFLAIRQPTPTSFYFMHLYLFLTDSRCLVTSLQMCGLFEHDMKLIWTESSQTHFCWLFGHVHILMFLDKQVSTLFKLRTMGLYVFLPQSCQFALREQIIAMWDGVHLLMMSLGPWCFLTAVTWLHLEVLSVKIMNCWPSPWSKSNPTQKEDLFRDRTQPTLSFTVQTPKDKPDLSLNIH